MLISLAKQVLMSSLDESFVLELPPKWNHVLFRFHLIVTESIVLMAAASSKLITQKSLPKDLFTNVSSLLRLR